VGIPLVNPVRHDDLLLVSARPVVRGASVVGAMLTGSWVGRELLEDLKRALGADIALHAPDGGWAGAHWTSVPPLGQLTRMRFDGRDYVVYGVLLGAPGSRTPAGEGFAYRELALDAVAEPVVLHAVVAQLRVVLIGWSSNVMRSPRSTVFEDDGLADRRHDSREEALDRGFIRAGGQRPGFFFSAIFFLSAASSSSTFLASDFLAWPAFFFISASGSTSGGGGRRGGGGAACSAADRATACHGTRSRRRSSQAMSAPRWRSRSWSAPAPGAIRPATWPRSGPSSRPCSCRGPVTGDNFRDDVTVDGHVNHGDTTLVKSKLP